MKNALFPILCAITIGTIGCASQSTSPKQVEIADMMKGARKLVGICTNVQPDETVLIVVDKPLVKVAEAIAIATEERDAEPVIAVIRQREVDGREPPEAVAAAMKKADVIFSPVSISITHTHAVKDAVAAGARVIVLTAFREETMVSGGIDADFVEIQRQSRIVGDQLAKAKNVHITSKEGTDLKFQIQDRKVRVMAGIVKPGEFSPVPNTEVNVSPIERTANGVLVADASIPYLGIGVLKKPIRFTVKDGFIVKIEGGDPEQVEKLKSAWKSQNDPNVYNIAELGLGMNPKCRFIGVMLEDEGVLGSVHIGTGTNITFGGHIKAASHYDLIMSAPTLTLDGEVLIDNGKVQI